MQTVQPITKQEIDLELKGLRQELARLYRDCQELERLRPQLAAAIIEIAQLRDEGNKLRRQLRLG